MFQLRELTSTKSDCISVTVKITLDVATEFIVWNGQALFRNYLPRIGQHDKVPMHSKGHIYA